MNNELSLKLSQRLINDVYQQVIEQFSQSNEDCKVLSSYLKDNMSLLKNVSPSQLLKGYNTLSELPDTNDDFQIRLQKSFGVNLGNNFYEVLKVVKPYKMNKLPF